MARRLDKLSGSAGLGHGHAPVPVLKSTCVALGAHIASVRGRAFGLACTRPVPLPVPLGAPCAVVTL